MKNRVKQLTALLLAMTMCLSLLSANVWATEVDASEGGAVSAQSSEAEDTAPEAEESEPEAEETAPETEESEPEAEEIAPEAEKSNTEEEDAAGESEPAEEEAPDEQVPAEEEDAAEESPAEEDASVTPQAIVGSGTCGKNGNNLTWTLDDAGELTISGTGEMNNWKSLARPWSEHQDSIRTVVIKGGVTSIGQEAFRSSCNLTSVTLPGSVTSIGDYAFYACDNLNSVAIADGVTSIGACAFCYCFDLTNVTIPNSVISIGENAFMDCRNLAEVKWPNPVFEVAQKSFSGTPWYRNNFAPTSGSCGGNAIWNYEKATRTLTISGTGGITSDSYSEDFGTDIQTLIIVDGITYIGKGSFWGCTNLQNVTIPDSVTSIGNGAFNYCKSLTSVTIPNSVTSIGDVAFYGCESLMSVTIPDSVTRIGSCAFGYHDVGEDEEEFEALIMGFTISGYNNSQAHRYAKVNKIPFVDLSPISCPSTFTRTVNTKKSQTFKLGASAKGAKLSYKPGNSKIKVDKNGKVTIPKGFMGTFTIVITSEATDQEKSATRTVTVWVNPSSTALSSVKWDKKKKTATVKWKKNATGKGYEVEYSTSRKFKTSVETVKIGKKATVKTTVKGLKKGTWYFRIRTVNGKNCSAWSKTKKVKVQ